MRALNQEPLQVRGSLKHLRFTLNTSSLQSKPGQHVRLSVTLFFLLCLCLEFVSPSWASPPIEITGVCHHAQWENKFLAVLKTTSRASHTIDKHFSNELHSPPNILLEIDSMNQELPFLSFGLKLSGKTLAARAWVCPEFYSQHAQPSSFYTSPWFFFI